MKASVPVDHILMIISDTVRWDYLGYNSGHVVTRNLDALAEKSTVFDRHYATSFPTVPARYDYLTGKASYAGVGWGPLPRHDYTITSDLVDAGYIALGVVDTPFYQAHGYYYDRGFHYFYDMKTQPLGTAAYFQGSRHFDPSKRSVKDRAGRQPVWPITGKLLPEPRIAESDHSAPSTITQVEKCLERLYREKFFTLVDMWDPHEPWDPPDYYVSRYCSDYAGERVYPPYGRVDEQGVTDRELQLARALYAGKLEMVDRWLGRLLEKLEWLSIQDTTAIIFTTDHGFYFGEHSFFGKMVRRAPGETTWLRSPLYEEITHVPLLIHVPGAEPRRVRGLTCALDIAPTLLELAGLPPHTQMLGRSLVPVVLGAAFEHPPAVVSALPLANPGDRVEVVDDYMRTVVEWQPATITSGEWALLYSTASEPAELYELARDPRQATNVAEKYPRIVEELTAFYVAELERVGAARRLRDARKT